MLGVLQFYIQGLRFEIIEYNQDVGASHLCSSPTSPFSNFFTLCY